MAYSDEELMRLALGQARAAAAADEVPIGAVLAVDGRIVAEGFNQPIRAVDPTAHAEIVVLRAAAQALGSYRLTGATLCVTIEPCVMCVGALVHARIGRLIYGAPEPRTGAVRSVLNLLDEQYWNHRVAVTAGVLEDDCRALVQDFFRARRP